MDITNDSFDKQFYFQSYNYSELFFKEKSLSSPMFSPLSLTKGDELIEEISFKVDKVLQLVKEDVVYDEQDKTIITIDQLKPNSTSVFYFK